MGIETLLSVVGSAMLSGMMGSKKPETPTQPAVAPDAPAKQAEKTPEAGVFRAKNAAAAGPSSTLLAGTGGVSDSMLSLSKGNTLLGA